jgi:spore coat protein U-like protein
MKVKLLRCIGIAFMLSMGAINAWAANINCSITTPSLSPTPSYSPFAAATVGTFAIAQAVTFSVSCTRDYNGGSTLTYKVSATNGGNQGGTPSTNRAIYAGTTNYYVPYDLYVDASCSTVWKATATYITGSVSWTGNNPTSTVAAASNHTFYVCIPVGSVTAVAGVATYLDNVTLSINNVVPPPGKTEADTTAALSVKITVPKECALTTGPGVVNFGTFTSLTGGAKTPNASFDSRCTNAGIYTTAGAYSMALDNVNGVVGGLNYTLGLNTAAGSTGSATLSATGTGASQTFYINGNMPGGQAGSCSGTACTATGASATHTLTITY